MRKLILVSLSAALLASCGGEADTTADTATDDAAATDAMATDTATDAATPASVMQPTDAAGYAAKAGAADKWEIDSSKALLAKSDNAGLKKFAQMMVDNHTESTNKVKTAARQANITLSEPKLDSMQQQMLDEIKNADSSAIDAIYTRHQKTAHQAALALHQAYSANGDTEAFKKVAGENRAGCAKTT